ncbi:MAG TPA: hypothetical protein VH165_31790 [Kofleriaceae bacterium]|nr:hypothetical protein [Kofleriaceae bacterium]
MSAIERDPDGVAVVWCPDFGLRDWLVDEVEGLAAVSAAPLRTASVDEAIKTPARMALLVPDDERLAVEELEGRRDQLLSEPARTQPVILFLLRDGDGRVALAKAPSLSSWVRGNDVDPDAKAEVDATADRSRFEAETGKRVEAWLSDWRAGAIPRDGEGFARAYWAALLERKGGGACGHAAFHCHVGLTLEHEPKVRVPLPAVAPADALDWLLSTVVPNWEPAPWTRIFGAQVAPQRA